MRASYVSLPLLLLIFCTCAPPPEENTEEIRNAVILTDMASWAPGELNDLRDSLTVAGYRTLVSGTAGETESELLSRLPWLLQPGIDLLLYDPRLAGRAVLDSLDKRLDVRLLELERNPSGPVVRSHRN